MAEITLLPSAKVPLIYEGDLTMTTEWYRFFWNIYGFTGTGVVPVDKGGTGLNTIGEHEIIIGNANNVFEPAILRGFGVSVTYDPGFVNIAIGASGVISGTYGTASSVGQFTVNQYGAITFADNVPIAISASQITSGQLPVLYGGTGASDAAGARANLSAAVLGVNNDITSMTGVTGGISSPDYIAFDTTYATPLTAGQLGWDGNNTLAIGMAGGNVTQHIGEDLFFYYKATSAVTKGQVVMFTGAVGASGVPTGAPATGITDGTYIMGIAAEDVALNGFGLVQSFGELRNVNTSGYADGDILWYDPAVTGGLTKTKPVAPNVKVQMAAVINGGSAGGGTILIRIDPGSTLGGTDSNAQINTPVNGDILTYDGANNYWKNTILTPGSGISISASATGVLTISNSSPSSGGTVTSVTLSTGSTGLTVSGGTTQTITGAGTFTIAGTLGVGYGGTGLTTLTAGYIPYGSGTSAFGSSSNLFWDSANSRLGLGVSNPSVRLDVQGTGTDHLFRALNTGIAASDDSILLIQTSSTGATSTISGLYFGDGDSQSVGQLRYNHSDNSMQFYTNSSVRMTIDNTGDVGVNTTSPNIAGWGKAFTLNGNAAENAAYELSFNGSLTAYLSYSSTDSSVNLFNFANANLYFGTNNTRRATVFASGGVSIGSNTDPSATNLLVAGSSTSASFIPSGSSVPTNGMYLSAANTVSLATASTQRISINSTGLITLASGSGLSIDRTAVTSPAAGDGNVFSGTYTPSLTNTTNIASSTAAVCQYMRVGSVVTVSGNVTIDPTATGRIVMGMSLPIASALTAATQCGGTFVGSGVTTVNLGSVIGDATNDRATFDGVVADTASRVYGFSFTYQVI